MKEQATSHSHDKFLVTVDAESRGILRVEQMGEAGELVEVPSSVLSRSAQGGTSGTSETTSPTPPSYAINIFMGSGEAPSITTASGDGAVEASSVEEPPMVIPSPGVIPSAGSLSTSSSEDEGHGASVQG